MQNRQATTCSIPCRASRAGFTLIELVVVLTIIALMATLSIPTFERAIEQSRIDIAAANLRAIWAAQRLYWLENHAYAANLSQPLPPPALPGLVQLGLLDAMLPIDSDHATYSTGGYYYQVVSSPPPTATTFAATATHMTGTQWQGSLTIDQTGAITGSVSDGTYTITPGYQ